MRRLAALVVTAVIALDLAPARADLAGRAGSINSDITMAANQVSVGLGALRQNYREFNDGLVATLPAILDTETGDIASLRLGYSGMLSYLYGQAQLSISAGDTTYVGYLQDLRGPTPVYTPFTGTTVNTIFNFTGRVGYPFRAGGRVALIPYVEVGEYYWSRDIGYVEDYNHLYIGLGGKILISPASRLVLEFGGGFGTTVLANMYTDGYDFNLGEKPYANVYTSVDYRFAGNWHLQWSAEYRKWEYGQSPVVAGFVEPRSETRQTQLLLSLGYTF